MEIVIFMFFILTMIMLMAKSRFKAVGIDNTHQFEPAYMSKLVDKIINHINFDFVEKYNSKSKTKEKWVGKNTSVNVEGKDIILKLSERDYDEACKKAYFGQTENFVGVDNATDWIYRNVYGQITKEELDNMRVKEVCALDMM